MFDPKEMIREYKKQRGTPPDESVKKLMSLICEGINGGKFTPKDAVNMLEYSMRMRREENTPAAAATTEG